MDKHQERSPQSLFAEPEEPVSRSLIPNHILDHASQRLFAISIFAAIQCWKIYDILLIKADAFTVAKAASAAGGTSVVAGSLTGLNNFTFVLKYAFIDGLFLWSLPVLNIPFLAFSPLFTLSLTVAINAVNFALTSNGALPLLSSTFVPLWNMFHKSKELTITGDSVSPQGSVNMNSHFRGRYTIQYLPESSVMLNPFNFQNMCLESPESGSMLFPSSINLPIEFNTTSDVGHVSIQRTTPENTIEYLNYTRKEIRKLVRRDYSKYDTYVNFVSTDERVFYLDAEIKQPGKYKIHQVLDVDGMTIRQYKSEFTIGHCPFAKFTYPGAESTYSGYKCFSKDASDLSWTVPMVSAFGMLPLTVQFATFQNGQQINSFEKTISDSEAKAQNGLSWLHSSTLTRNSIEQELLRAPQNFKKIGSGKLEFQLLSVADSYGNQRIYNVQSKDKEVNFPIELKQAPLFSLKDTHPARRLILNSSKTLYVRTSGEVTFPMKVTLTHVDEHSPEKTENIEYTFKNAEALENGLQITKPGKYFLLSGSDKYCPCQADSTPIIIETPPLPSVEIKDVPIFDKCVGTIGYEFDLRFGGSPPFEVIYEVYQNRSNALKPVLSDRGTRQHKQKSNKHDFSFNFQPQQEGDYILIFKSLKDLHYNRDPVPISQTENTFSTHIKKRSQFMFFKGSRARVENINLCKDQSTEVPVHLEGHLPFSFRSEIVNLKSGKVLQSHVHGNQASDSVSLHIPKFAEGGDYGVYLRDVTDSLGCPVEMPYDQQIRIKARKDSPVVEIAESASTLIVEGDAVRIPLQVHSSSGRSSDDKIVYSWTSLVDSKSTKNLTVHGKADLVVKAEGIFKLESFINGGCSGTVKNHDHTFTVRYHAKPGFAVIPTPEQVATNHSNSFVLNPLCQGEKQKVRIELVGQKPFVVNYEIKFPSGNEKSASLQIDNDEIALPLPSSREGKYQIVFTRVYDSLYTKEKMQKLSSPQTTSTISYEVKAHASLKVKEPFKQVCETKVKEDFDLEIPLLLSGVAPYRIEGEIIAQDSTSRPFVISDLRQPAVNLRDFNIEDAYSDVFSVGEHRIVFNSISDASHCERSLLTEDNQVVVSITEVPSISKRPLKEHYCVGDRISYNMSGVSPFTVYYKFNEENRKANVKNDFTRLATKPGDLTIVALQDSSASQCLVNVTNHETEYEKLKLRVHDLPSVEISHGDSIIKNIHEGDQSEITFKFIGTPPFSVTYVRTLGDEDDQHKKRKTRAQRGHRKVVETKTVSDIWDFEYSEVVSLQGTYEAIEVTDAFCGASRDVKEVLLP